MKKVFSLCIIIFISLSIYSQINSIDSSYLAKPNWSINDMQSYTVTNRKLRIKQNADTTLLLISKYNVDITVLNADKLGYTLKWHYKNIEMLPENKLSKAILSITNNMNAIIRTDEMGSFKELVNWVEISDYVKKSAEALKVEMADVPNIEKTLSQIEQMYSTKEAIEAAVIKEMKQFHHFYGAKYKLGLQKTDAFKLPNISGGTPFNAKAIVTLDEIDTQNDNAIIRYWQSIDPEEIKQAAYAKIVSILKESKAEIPKIESFGPMKNETLIMSRMHGSTGWVMYNLQAQEVSADGVSTLDECVIELN